MSHTFWAGIFVWLTCWLMALAFYGRAALEQPVLTKASLQSTKGLPELGDAQSCA